MKQRRVESGGTGDRLSYLLMLSDGQRELTVFRHEASGSFQVELRIDGKAIDIFDSDVTVIPPEPLLSH